MTNNDGHGINLAALSRATLKQLQLDVADELAVREDDDRVALEDKLRMIVEEAGFDPSALHIGPAKKRGRPTGNRNNGKAKSTGA